MTTKLKNYIIRLYLSPAERRKGLTEGRMLFGKEHTKTAMAEKAREFMKEELGHIHSIESIDEATPQEMKRYYSYFGIVKKIRPSHLPGWKESKKNTIYSGHLGYRNPGAAWHHDRYNAAFERAYDQNLPMRSRHIASGMAEEAMVSEWEANRLGMSNPIKKSPILLYALIAGLGYWFYKNRK